MHYLKILFCCSGMFLLVFFQVLNAQDKHMHEEFPVAEDASIGDVDFRIDCSESVQDDFNQALGMLHHMMYATARENFKEITATDPDCAMAYWGIATTLFQPLWGTLPTEEELNQGWQTVNKAQELVDSEREEFLIRTTAEFFRDPETADFWTRINRWADAMEAAYESPSNDLDIASLYGLSRLALAQVADNREPLHDEAEAVLRNIFEQLPTHPGAIHYTIHATDIDKRAGNALDIVEAYGEIAPSVPHALHMPTHIYVRLGDWPGVIEWNLRSAEAALNHPVDSAESHHYLHALDYLVYAYLQQGQSEKAEAVYKEVLNKKRHQGSFISAFHFSAIPARLAVEQRDWKRAVELEPRTPEYLPWKASPWPEGLTWYAKGLGAIHTGDIELAEKAEQKLVDLRDLAREEGANDIASYIEMDHRVLQGWIAYARGNGNEAVKLMRSAAELEESTEKHPVTPGALQPPYEALGDLLIKLDRPSEALKAYEASDSIWPGRLNTLMGAVLSARLIGGEQIAQKHFKKLLSGVGVQ